MAVRKYYVKLENINNRIIKEEIEEKEQLLLEQKEEIEEKERLLLEQKEIIIYGYTDNIQQRLTSHKRDYKKDCQLIYCIESKINLN